MTAALLAAVLLSGSAASAQPRSGAPLQWHPVPADRRVVGLLSYRGGWHVALEETTRQPRAVALAPIGPSGIAAEVSRSQPQMTSSVSVLAAGRDGGEPWVIGAIWSEGDAGARIYGYRIGAPASDPPVVIGERSAPNEEITPIAWAHRPGPRPEGIALWQVRAQAPPSARDLMWASQPADDTPPIVTRTRARWLEVGAGARSRRFERLPTKIVRDDLDEERARIALAPDGGASMVRSRLLAPGRATERWSLDVIRFDAAGAELDRRRDLLRRLDADLQDILVDAAGATWVAALASPATGGQDGVRPQELQVLRLAATRRAPPEAQRIAVTAAGESTTTAELVECGSSVWAVAATTDTHNERVLAARADSSTPPIELARRTLGPSVLPITRIHLDCAGSHAAALLVTAGTSDLGAGTRIAFTIWNAAAP